MRTNSRMYTNFKNQAEQWGDCLKKLVQADSIGLNKSEARLLFHFILHGFINGECSESFSEIEAQTGFSQSTIIRVERELQDRGIIEVIRREYENGGAASNEVKINWAVLGIRFLDDGGLRDFT